MAYVHGAWDKLWENTDPMLLTQSGTDYRTGEPCEWITPTSKTTGYLMQVLSSGDGAELTLSASDDNGGYVYLDTDDIDALIAALTQCRDAALRSQHGKAVGA